MAVLQTGTGSLRGAAPRAPIIDQRAFELDVQSFGNAATMPGRTAETIEDLQERRAERTIRNATRPARRTAAVTAAEGMAARSPIEQQILLEQAMGGANRVGREQELASRVVDRGLETFDVETQELLAATDARLEEARNRAEQARLDAEALQQNRDAILTKRRNAAANEVTETQIGAVTGGQRLAAAEGTPGSRTVMIDGAEVVQDFITSPTGEQQVVGSKERMSARQIQMEQAKLDTEMQRAAAYAKSIENQTGRKVNARTFQNKDIMGNTVSLTTVITDPQTGEQIDIRTVPINAGGAPSRLTPQQGTGSGLDEMRSSLGTQPTPQATPAPAASPQSQAAPIQENGRQFIPTGPKQGPYFRGVVYNHPTLGRMLYTGGDPFDPNSFQPVQ